MHSLALLSFRALNLQLFGSNNNAPASGLYYLSEIVEEHTKLAKVILTRLIYFIMGFQLLLFLFDGFPLSITGLGIFCHLVYLGNMRKFPVVQLSDPLFIASCGKSSISQALKASTL